MLKKAKSSSDHLPKQYDSLHARQAFLLFMWPKANSGNTDAGSMFWAVVLPLSPL